MRESKAIQYFELTISVHQYIFKHIMKIEAGHTCSETVTARQSSERPRSAVHTLPTDPGLQDNILNEQQPAALDS